MPPTRKQAQCEVLAALEELKASVVTAGDSVKYLGEETTLLEVRDCVGAFWCV